MKLLASVLVYLLCVSTGVAVLSLCKSFINFHSTSAFQEMQLLGGKKRPRTCFSLIDAILELLFSFYFEHVR